MRMDSCAWRPDAAGDTLYLTLHSLTLSLTFSLTFPLIPSRSLSLTLSLKLSGFARCTIKHPLGSAAPFVLTKRNRK